MGDLNSSSLKSLNRAVSAYSSGKLVEAEQLCEQIVTAQQDFFDALHLLALVQSLLGKKEAALASYDRALKVRPDCGEALSNRGVTLHELKRFEEALASYDRALKVQPDYAEALSNRGLTLHKLKRFPEALACYDRALKARPDYAEALSNRGLSLHELKRFEEALASYDRALKMRPDYAEALSYRGLTLHELKWFVEALASYDRALKVRPDYAEALSYRGLTLHELKRFDEALASYDRALKVQPDYAEALSNRGLTLHELKRFEEALASYDRALKVQPDYAEALSNRGVTLRELKRFEEALASYDRALKMRPDFAKALSNRGTTLHELKRFEEALASYDRALKVQPDYAEALSNRGVALHELTRFEEALASFDRALKVRPDFADAHYNEALCRMLIGDFDRGWQKCEWRWESEQAIDQKRNFAQPLWLGTDEIAGKAILLHSEQGFGDMIQFCRYVPLVAERAAGVILEIPEPLHGLMSTLSGTAQIVSKGDPLPHFDTHCPLLSLPLAFGTRLETIPSATPYLHASPQAVASWNTRLGRRNRARIGLVWSGRPTHKNDRNRSLKLSTLLPLLDFDATFLSLQREVRADDTMVLRERRDILHFGDELRNFSDTAALISNPDLLISVDTSVAHLAGALAKPVWVMLPFIPDWRWLLDRKDSPWYPTARLFRQDDTRAWDAVIVRVHRALHDFVQKSFVKTAQIDVEFD
ncbi:MAG: tetratricopeptide repeat protein [Xanthobacteraceae bacterium]